jgi:hypothetical protein
LRKFVDQVTSEMAAEYQRIRERARADPGTAGDEGEENWATLLREWLPSTYQVVTKGRILGADGAISRQVDVVVLKPGYPAKLAEKKTHIAEGVAAAFECKITLKADHLLKAATNAAAIKELTQAREGTPYRELTSPIVYGVLCHSHSWKGPTSVPYENITAALLAADGEAVKHPRQMLDVVCVADLGTWTPMKMAGMGPSTSRR